MSDTYELLTVPWIEKYLEVWNQNEKAINGTKGLGGLVQLEVTDQGDRPPVQFNMAIDGTGDYAGPIQEGSEPRFTLIATTEVWRKVAFKEMGVRRAVTGPIKFQGSLMTALKYFSGLEAALLQFGDVPTTEWS